MKDEIGRLITSIIGIIFPIVFTVIWLNTCNAPQMWNYVCFALCGIFIVVSIVRLIQVLKRIL